MTVSWFLNFRIRNFLKSAVKGPLAPFPANCTLQISHAISVCLCQKADLATERERQLTTARANQLTGLNNGRATNFGHRVLYARFPVVKSRSRSVAKSAKCPNHADRQVSHQTFSYYSLDRLITRWDEFTIETIVCCPDLRNYLLVAEEFEIRLRVVFHFPAR